MRFLIWTNQVAKARTASRRGHANKGQGYGMKGTLLPWDCDGACGSSSLFFINFVV